MLKKMNVSKENKIYMWLSAPNKIHVWILIVLAILILVTPIVYRAFESEGTLIGPESYENLYWSGQPFEIVDSLDYASEPYVGERAWFAILSLAPLFLSKWLPFVLGLLSIGLFYLIIKKLKKEYAFLSTLILLISPLTIFLYSVSTKYAAAFFLFLLGVFFYLNDRKIAAVVTVIVMSFFSFAVAFFVWLAYLAYKVYSQSRSLSNVWKLLGGLFISLLIQFGYLWWMYGTPGVFFISDLGFATALGNLFVDLGAKQGFGLFFFIISLFGIYTAFEEKFRYVFVYLILAFVLFLSLQFGFLLYFVNFVLAFFVAVALIDFLTKEWKLDFAKKLAILFLICGLVFSFVAFMNIHVDSSPDSGMARGIRILQNEGGDSVVLSDPSMAGYIQYGGNVPLVSDKIFYYSSPEQRLKDIEWFYSLNNFGNVEVVIAKYNISYVWIDSEMEDRIWSGSESDLIYLMESAFKKFFNAHSSETLNMWEYFGEIEVN